MRSVFSVAKRFWFRLSGLGYSVQQIEEEGETPAGPCLNGSIPEAWRQGAAREEKLDAAASAPPGNKVADLQCGKGGAV